MHYRKKRIIETKNDENGDFLYLQMTKNAHYGCGPNTSGAFPAHVFC